MIRQATRVSSTVTAVTAANRHRSPSDRRGDEGVRRDQPAGLRREISYTLATPRFTGRRPVPTMEYTVKDIPSLIQAVQRDKQGLDEELWFHETTKTAYDLVPSAHRRYGKSNERVPRQVSPPLAGPTMLYASRTRSAGSTIHLRRSALLSRLERQGLCL